MESIHTVDLEEPWLLLLVLAELELVNIVRETEFFKRDGDFVPIESQCKSTFPMCLVYPGRTRWAFLPIRKSALCVDLRQWNRCVRTVYRSMSVVGAIIVVDLNVLGIDELREV